MSEILFISSEIKQRSECSQRFHLNSSEVKERNVHSQRISLHSSKVKPGSKGSQTFHFDNIDEVKQSS